MILLIRPEQDSQRIAPDFQNLGYDVISSPLLHIHHKEVALPHHHTLCLSSKNTLFALKSLPKKTPIYCVGVHVADSLKDLGFCHVVTAPTAQELLEMLQEDMSLKTILYLAGEVSTLDFSKHILHCHKVICYEAIAQDTFSPEALSALQKEQITHIPLYSMRSFKILIKLLIKNKIDLGRIILLALSQDIANQAEHFDFKGVLIAKVPTHQSVLNLIVGCKNAPEEK